MEVKEMEAALEAILFAAGEPIGVERLCLGLEVDRPTLDAVAQRCAVPIIASGGAGKMDDFKELFLNHPRVDAGLAASIFHTKQVDIRDLKLYLRENGVEMRV